MNEKSQPTINSLLDEAVATGRAEDVAYIKLHSLFSLLVRTKKERNEDFLNKCADLSDAAISLYREAVIYDIQSSLFGSGDGVRVSEAEKVLCELVNSLGEDWINSVK